jgi:hypothetical protein
MGELKNDWAAVVMNRSGHFPEPLDEFVLVDP